MTNDLVPPPGGRALGAAVGRAWTARFGLIWLGLWAAQLAPIQLLLPLQLAELDPDHKVRDFALVNGLTGIAALVALPLFGALSDRSRSPLGRRRRPVPRCARPTTPGPSPDGCW